MVATNDRWESAENASAVVAASRTAGAFTLAANSEDAAILITLPPGAYTVEVKGKKIPRASRCLRFTKFRNRNLAWRAVLTTGRPS